MTVNELIEKLSGYAPDAPVELVDADTGWRIPEIHIHRVDNSGLNDAPAGTIVLWGEYGEMIAPG